MKRLLVSDILKPGATLTARKINPNSAKFKKQMKELEKAWEDSERRKRVDWAELDRMYITI